MLAPLHVALLPKLKVMRIFPIVIRDSPVEFGGLGLHSLEIESLVQAVNLFVLLQTAYILIQSLLRIMTEYVQLKIGLTAPFLTL